MIFKSNSRAIVALISCKVFDSFHAAGSNDDSGSNSADGNVKTNKNKKKSNNNNREVMDMDDSKLTASTSILATTSPETSSYRE